MTAQPVHRPSPRPVHLLPVPGLTGPGALRGIDEQVTKSERPSLGRPPVKGNRFVVEATSGWYRAADGLRLRRGGVPRDERASRLLGRGVRPAIA
jgi:hypothetical protein